MDQQTPPNLTVDKSDQIDVLVNQAAEEENLEKACDLLIQAVELNNQLNLDSDGHV